MTVSYWRDRSWSSEHHADVVVVGAGLCGAGCAWWLAQQGLGVTLVDATEPGGGTSTEGLGLVAGPAEHYGRTVDRLGRQRARELQRFCRAGRDALLQYIVGDEEQQVSLADGGVLSAASTARSAEELERSGALLREDGFDAEWLDRQAVATAVSGEGLLGGLLDPVGRSVHPRQLLERLLTRCMEAGVQVKVRQRVFAVESESGGVTVRSEAATLRAEQVVLCQGGQSALLDGALSEHLRPRLGQLLATAPVAERVAPWSLIVDQGAVQAQQLPAGEVVAACWRDPTGRGPWEAICRYLGQLCNERVTHQWRWRVSEPVDGFPVVGALPGQERVKYLVSCVDGGIALGFGAAQVAAQYVVEGAPPELLGSARFSRPTW